MFEGILGNAPIQAYLLKTLEQGRLPHALLFAGPDGIGKSLFAKALAIHLLQAEPGRVMSEIHPDFHPIRPEGKIGLHTMEAFRRLIDDVHAAPFEAPARVFVVYDADRAPPISANALLKTLEEPTTHTTLILLTSALQEMFPTILSRCSILRFQPLKTVEIASLLAEKGIPEHYARRARGSIGKALELAAQPAWEQVLFSLLAHKKSYYELALSLEKIASGCESEDPVVRSHRMEDLFASILMWHRDQQAKQLGVERDLLFFPDAPAAQAPPQDLIKIMHKIEEARLALSRNIKLSICLEKIFQ